MTSLTLQLKSAPQVRENLEKKLHIIRTALELPVEQPYFHTTLDSYVPPYLTGTYNSRGYAEQSDIAQFDLYSRSLEDQDTMSQALYIGTNGMVGYFTAESYQVRRTLQAFLVDQLNRPRIPMTQFDLHPQPVTPFIEGGAIAAYVLILADAGITAITGIEPSVREIYAVLFGAPALLAIIWGLRNQSIIRNYKNLEADLLQKLKSYKTDGFVKAGDNLEHLDDVLQAAGLLPFDRMKETLDSLYIVDNTK